MISKLLKSRINNCRVTYTDEEYSDTTVCYIPLDVLQTANIRPNEVVRLYELGTYGSCECTIKIGFDNHITIIGSKRIGIESNSYITIESYCWVAVDSEHSPIEITLDFDNNITTIQ